MAKWKVDHAIELTGNIDGIHAARLFEELGISRYLAESCKMTNINFTKSQGRGKLLSIVI